MLSNHDINSPDPYLRPVFPFVDKLRRYCWSAVWTIFCKWTPYTRNKWRIWLLRLFGAKIGASNFIYPTCKIWAPWLLQTGEVVAIGPGVEIYNPGGLRMGNHAVISQHAFICGATHDYNSEAFTYIKKEIVMEPYVWIGAKAIVLPGVYCREGSVLGAGTIATRNLEPWTVYAGNPARPVKKRNNFLRSFFLLVFCAFFDLSKAQVNLPFIFSLPANASTSAGVFSKDSILLKTLWSGVAYTAGSHTATWDGTLDDGKPAPPADYYIRVLSNNVRYHWDGVIGNTSSAVSGPTVLRFFERMYGMAIPATSAYFSTGYNEGSPSQAKFLTSNPRVKVDVLPSSGTGQATLFLTTDGNNVYYGGSDAFSPNNSHWFVYATRTANDAETLFANGHSLAATIGRTYPSAIDIINDPNATVSGMAVQKTGPYLFVSHKKLNELHVLDKTTGALVRKIALTAPMGLTTDNNNNLWAIYTLNGQTVVHKFTVQADGSLSAPVLSLTGLQDPLAMAVSPDGATLVVADGGSSQQLKAFDNAAGTALWTFGQIGGYLNDPTVANDKFYFSDLSGSIHESFIAFQPDGSFWVGDIGNYRTLHFSAARNYVEQMMFLRHNYSIAVDPTNPSRVFAEYLEFKIDYSKPLAPNNGSWTLVKNWRGAVPANYYQDFIVNIFKFVTTLSNGRTYAILNNLVSTDFELVELPPTGNIRFTGFSTPSTIRLNADGSIIKYAIAGLARPAYWQRFPLKGLDAAYKPQWSMHAGDTLAVTPVVTGEDPVDYGTRMMTRGQSSSYIVISFDKDLIQNGHGSGYHLGGIRAGDHKWLWRTAKSTATTYRGPFPADGSFDVGNEVQYPGGVALVADRNIFWGYHVEFWKASQVNKWNQVYDDGLFIGQFGVTGPEVAGQIAAPMMAGNVFSANVVKDANGDLYLYHNDESHHSALHRWKISGLNTIKEQTMPVTIQPFQSGLVGQYFDDNQLNNFDIRNIRVDSTVNNNAVPAEIQNKTAYSVRWTGYVLPTHSETYTFYVNTDKGARLWVDNQLIVDNWTNASQLESQVTISLNSGTKYAIRLDGYRSNTSLSWSSGSQPKQVLPSASLIHANPPDTSNGIDLMEGLPFDQVLQNNLYGWSRNPASEDYTGSAYLRWWSVKSGLKAYDYTKPADVSANYAQISSTYTINRDLGNNHVTNSWKIAGDISYEGNNANSSDGQGGVYFEVLDAAGKIIARFYPTLFWSNNLPYMSVTANKAVLASDKSGTIQPVLTTVEPISITAAGGKVTFNYAGYAPVVTTIFDPSSDWQTPKTMRLYFWTSGSNYSRAMDLLNMRFSADKLVTVLPLQFTSISAQTTGKDVNVSWTSVNEVNTASFQVERSSDGTSWQTAGTVPAVNQPGNQHYSYTDKNTPGGVLYYRVKETDRDGQTQYSQITVVGRGDSKFSFYPNPVIKTPLANYPPVS